MRDVYFEELIRQKLQNMEVPFNPEDWKDMESMMDELSEIEDSSPKDQSKQESSPEDLPISETLLTDFDKEILNKLENYQEAPISWRLGFIFYKT